MRNGSQKHTPTPRPYHLANYGWDGDDRLIVGPNNELIADCYPDSCEDYELPEDYRQNAALLCHAANNYDALVLAAKCALADLEGFMVAEALFEHEDHPAMKTIEELRGVLAKIEGERKAMTCKKTSFG